jgi:pyruvate dehydrogenase E1 component alpha subunit
MPGRAASAPPLQILSPAGALVADSPLPLARIKDLYRAMVAARAYDKKCSAMQRQGRLATYAQFEGQEAAQIGAVAAIEPRDWVVGTYRDAAAMWFHGYPWLNLILGRTGDERGGHAPAGVNVLPPSITVGAHMIHAVGIGWASRIRNDHAVAMTFFGDGATSEGDFHEAMNFAGVFRTPTVFVCQNNGWAISMPRERQTASETIAQKAEAYGMAGVLVDGNDLLAVYAAAHGAVARARGGEGATLIEAVTYRMGPHTTTDDAGRYRDVDHVAEWVERDPLERVRRYLEANGDWTADWQREVETGEADAVEAAVEEAEALPPFDAAGIFDGMFAELPAALRAQQRAAQEGAG